jgi:hypothetical protein
VIFSLIVVFPVEIALFGIYLFDRNPSPMVLKPVPYVVLMVIDAIAVLWSLLLLVQGLKVAQGIGTAKAATLVIVVTVAAGVLAALR